MVYIRFDLCRYWLDKPCIAERAYRLLAVSPPYGAKIGRPPPRSTASQDALWGKKSDVDLRDGLIFLKFFLILL